MDSIYDECWADIAINLSLESKDAINCELIRTIHKAVIKHLNLTLFFFSPQMFKDLSRKEMCLCSCWLRQAARLRGEPGEGQSS